MSFRIGTPHARGAGYFVNDQALRSRQEDDVQTCPHCQRVIKMREWAAAPVQNFCLKCMRPTCDAKECQECVPFIAKIDRYFDALVKYQQHLRAAGLEPAAPKELII